LRPLDDAPKSGIACCVVKKGERRIGAIAGFRS
jgi:hypothetical protein